MSLRPLLRPPRRAFAFAFAFASSQPFRRCYSHKRHSSPPFQTVQSCPSPTCACGPMPPMPEGLPIDHSKPLNGSMAGYAEQILICTGKSDWPSKIEEEDSGDNLAADIKELVGRGGIYSDPYHNTPITNASFPSSVPKRPEVQTTSAYLLPSFKYIPFIPRVSFAAVDALIKGYVQPTHLHPAHDVLSPIHRDRLLRSEAYQALLHGVTDVTDILVLICGHGGRDMRCGILGPVLQAEFQRTLPGAGIEVAAGPVEVGAPDRNVAGAIDGLASPVPAVQGPQKLQPVARVATISHVGGHKFAGNVIVYIPPTARGSGGAAHPLAGYGIWYGRVEPRHVDGIVRETIVNGRVIADLFRGGVRQGGEVLRL